MTTPWGLGAIAVPPFTYLLVWLTTKHRMRLKADAGFARRRRARREAQTRIRQALSNTTPNHQLNGLASAMAGYLSDRFDLLPGGLTPQEVRSLLVSRGFEEPIVAQIAEFLETCDAVRYAPHGMDSLSPSQTAVRVRGWIKKLERGRP